jgi:hypothetical protein
MSRYWKDKIQKLSAEKERTDNYFQYKVSIICAEFHFFTSIIKMDHYEWFTKRNFGKHCLRNID